MKFNIIAISLLFVGYTFGAYSGTPQTPSKVDGCYQIGSAEELYGFAELVNDTTNGLAKSSETCAKLTANIIVNENVLKNDSKYPDFHRWQVINQYSGSFDGQNHTISGLYFNDINSFNLVGFFGYLVGNSENQPATVKNLGIIDSRFVARWGVGAIASEAKNIIIENSYSSAKIESEAQFGGLIGFIVGKNIILNSYNTGYIHGTTVSNTDRYGGGLLGQVSNGTTIIKNSYNTGLVYTRMAQGGLVGFVGPRQVNLFIDNSYSYGNMDMNLVGSSDKSVATIYLSNSYFLSKETNNETGAKTSEEFANGAVALALHYGLEGDIWGQNIGTDTLPNLSGNLQNYPYSYKISKLNLHTYDGDTTKYKTQYVEGINVLLPTPSRKGFMFAGWYKDSSFTGEKFTSITKDISGNLDLYAHWWSKPPIKDGCYEISTASEMYMFAAIVNGTLGDSAQAGICGKLTADIALNAPSLELKQRRSWTPMNYFFGTFDGQGHTISGLYYNNPDVNNIGLFGSYVGGTKNKPAIIQNLGLIDSYINACWYVGGIVGTQSGYLILKNVYNTSKMTTAHYGGSLVGYVYQNGELTIINSYSAAQTDNDAGLIGGLDQGVSATIKNTFNYGSYDTGIYPYADFIGKKDTTNKILIVNSFNNKHNHEYTGSAADSSQFANGAVLTALHNYSDDDVDGSIWGQIIDTDPYPTLNSKYSNTGFKTSTATFHLNNKNDSSYSISYIEGLGKFVPNPNEGSWIFKGWFESKTLDGDRKYPIQATEKGNKVYYADWIRIKAPALDKDCYAISNVDELYGFAAIVNGTYEGIDKNEHACGKLTNDIILYKNLFTQDGKLIENSSDLIAWTPIKSFSGTLDGQGHSIKGLYVSHYYVNGGGLFFNLVGDSTGNAVIKNLGITESYIKGGSIAGSLAGIVIGNVTIENCFNTSKVIGDGSTGGFIGRVDSHANLTISNSYNIGQIDDGSTGEHAGGFVGGLRPNGHVTIINSYNASLLNDNTADLVKTYEDSLYTIENSYYISFNIQADTVKTKGLPATPIQFADSTIAKALHDYNKNGIDGSIWGQNVGVDTHPVHSGKISYSSNPVVISFSSSSSTAESSESSEKSSSSSSEKINITTIAQKALQARIYQQDHSILVENFVGNVFVFDLNGNLIRSVYSNGQATIHLQRTGSYIVKTGAYSRRISLITSH